LTERRQLTLDDGEAGLAIIEAKLASDPTNKEWNEARHWMLMSLGRLSEGWPEYKWHLGLGSQVSYDTFPVAKWDGSDLTGKHVLVWTDHGIGDQVFAAGMFPDLIKIAGSVTIMCNRRLAPVFRRSFPQAITYRVGDPVPRRLADWRFDFQLSHADVGAAVRPHLNFRQPAYLQADPVKKLRFRDKYRADGKRLIGLSWWSQNAIHGLGKSMCLTFLAPLLQSSGARLVNLQYGDTSEELAELGKAGVEIVNDQSFNQLTDLDSFVAQVAALDFVITTSNTTAHVAGALGKPGVVLLPRGSTGRFWYWHNERADSPWYPSLTLARQETPGDWPSAVRRAHPTVWNQAHAQTAA
jgi:ADP-heptose:LPS heptosyltransferase